MTWRSNNNRLYISKDLCTNGTHLAPLENKTDRAVIRDTWRREMTPHTEPLDGKQGGKSQNEQPTRDSWSRVCPFQRHIITPGHSPGTR